MTQVVCETKAAPPSFFTNYAHVLILIGSDNSLRMRDIAERIGITERAVQRIVEELIDCGYIVVTKSGRRNRYTLDPDSRIEHFLSPDLRVKDLLELAIHPHATDPSIHKGAAIS
jgi:DNA-binding transcriptional regulator LsrR (DeoR family)